MGGYHKHLLEYTSILARLGVSLDAPPAGTKVRKRTRKITTRTTVKIFGVAVGAVIVWTVTYDKNTMGLLEARRDYHHEIGQRLFIVSTVVFLTLTGTNTWTKDPSWNDASNTVEGIGCGATGVTGSNGAGLKPPTTGAGGVGGGAGAYSLKSNVTLSGNPSYTIGAANSSTDTSFNSGSMVAKAATANSVTAGTAAGSTGDTKFSGGTGGSATASGAGGGGGGAAGLHGAGSNGSNGSGTTGGGGGNGDNGNTTGNGTNGVQWDATHGSGSGGLGAAGRASAGVGNTGGGGGSYGAGGGGGGGGFGGGAGGAPGAGGAGTQGLIVLTWTVAATGGMVWRSFFDHPANRLVHKSRKRMFMRPLHLKPTHRFITPPQPSNLSWFQQNPIVRRKPTRPRKRFILKIKWKLPRMLAYLPPSNLSWFQQNPIVRRKPMRPRKRFRIQYLFRRKIDITGLPLPSNLSWFQQNPIVRRKPMRSRKRFRIVFRHMKVPKAIVNPPRPSNLSWMRNPQFTGLKKSRGRKRFKIMGRWLHMPKNFIGEYVLVTQYTAAGPGSTKWRMIKPKLQRNRVGEGSLQK